MSEVGVVPKEQEGIAVVETEETPTVDPLMQEAHAVVTQVKQNITGWPEYQQALIALQRARGKVSPYDRIIFEKDGDVYIVGMRGGEESNIEDVDIKVTKASAIPADLSLDDLRGVAIESPAIKWDRILQARSVRERKLTERSSIGYSEGESWQFNTPVAIAGAKKFAAELASKSPNPVIDSTGRVI